MITEDRGGNSGSLVKKLTKKFIQMRCTDSAVAWVGFVGGAIGIFLETMSLTTDYWLYTIEPVKINRTEDETTVSQVKNHFHTLK